MGAQDSEPGPNSLLGTHGGQRKAILDPPQTETPSSPSVKSVNYTYNPPRRPNTKGLMLPQKNAAIREYEKNVYNYLNEHGKLSTEPCGPCQRTGTRCIRHPAISKKCALCYRGHDVCEYWDESVENTARRRTIPKKKAHQEVNKVTPELLSKCSLMGD